jgi:hypothetical protein
MMILGLKTLLEVRLEVEKWGSISE